MAPCRSRTFPTMPDVTDRLAEIGDRLSEIEIALTLLERRISKASDDKAAKRREYMRKWREKRKAKSANV